MSWNQFCDLYRIPPKLKNASLKHNSRMPQKRTETACNWISRPHRSIVLSGPAGRGKTYLLHCLMKGLCLKGYGPCDIRYFKGKVLDDRFLEEVKECGSSKHLMQQLQEIQFLFIDDFGIERDSERAEREIYEIIDYRNDWEKPTIISTNISFERSEEVFGERLASRLREYCWINFKGNDLRGML